MVFRLAVRVLPGARAESVGGSWMDASGSCRLIVRVCAQPKDGRANDAVCAAVAASLDLPKTAITVTAGAKSRLKMLAVETGDHPTFLVRLEALMKAEQ